MEYGKTINIAKVKKDAENYYNSGFYCSEAIVASIRENFNLDISADIVMAASGFPVGIGGAKCLCGAVSGGIIALGLFFGRNRPNDKKIKLCMKLSAELHDYFKGQNRALCCRVLTSDLKLGSGKHMEQCTYFTGQVAEKTAQIIARELKIKNLE